MERYFINESLTHDAQIYPKKLTVLYAVIKTICYRIRLRSEMCPLRMGPLAIVIRRTFLIRGRTADLSYSVIRIKP